MLLRLHCLKFFSSAGLVLGMAFHCPAGNPTLLGELTNGLDASHIRLHQSTTNVFVAGFFKPQSLQVISVTNPAAPLKTGGLSLAHSASRLTLSEDETQVYMVGFFGGLKIVSVDNLAFPVLQGAYNPGGNARDVAVSADNRTAYLAMDSSGVHILSVTNPAQPHALGVNTADFTGSGGAMGLALSSDEALLYVATGDSGIKVLSVTNPATPDLVGNFETGLISPLSAVYRFSDRDRLFALGGGTIGEPGLHILSITNPISPSVEYRYEDPVRSGGFADMALSSDASTAFLVGNNVGLQVVDVTTGMAPAFVDEFYEVLGESAPQVTGIALSKDGNIAYLAHSTWGLRVVNVSGVYDIDDDGLPNWWERTYFGSITGGDMNSDNDGDGMSNLQEYLAGTMPNNPTSVFKVVSIHDASQPSIAVPSVLGRSYSLLHSTALGMSGQWTETTDATNVAGTGSTLVLVDPNSSTGRFYRVRAELHPE